VAVGPLLHAAHNGPPPVGPAGPLDYLNYSTPLGDVPTLSLDRNNETLNNGCILGPIEIAKEKLSNSLQKEVV
jgi:hypothetical protein